jgi:hypothetical protein
MEALDKASKEFKKLRKENDQWVISYDINKYIKNAPYNNVGNFIRAEFQFTNTYLKGKSVYFYKKDLINLSKELDARNIDLARYMELNRIPQGLKDISAKQKIKKPLPELKAKLDLLMEEYSNDSLAEHIELLGESSAFYKDFSYYSLKDDLRKRLSRWIRAYQNVKHEIGEYSLKKK